MVLVLLLLLLLLVLLLLLLLMLLLLLLLLLLRSVSWVPLYAYHCRLFSAKRRTQRSRAVPMHVILGRPRTLGPWAHPCVG
jgi:hypothetical protein